jgi:carbon storage regulator
MLVLSRKVGEVITIGKSVTITVINSDRGVVRLGIDAPKNIPVHRKEVFDAIVKLNYQASKTKISDFKKALVKTNLINEKKEDNE